MSAKAKMHTAKVAKDRQFQKVAHSFTKKVCHWFYCSGCGLVALKNESTRKRMQEPCDAMEEK
jgi:hypothetical protein